MRRHSALGHLGSQTCLAMYERFWEETKQFLLGDGKMPAIARSVTQKAIVQKPCYLEIKTTGDGYVFCTKKLIPPARTRKGKGKKYFNNLFCGGSEHFNYPV